MSSVEAGPFARAERCEAELDRYKAGFELLIAALSIHNSDAEDKLATIEAIFRQGGWIDGPAAPADEAGLRVTSAERIEAAERRFRQDGDAGTGWMGAVLDAALADVGGLDGLERLDWRDRERRKVDEDFRELRADRDRLREALRQVAAGRRGRHHALVALRESENHN